MPTLSNETAIEPLPRAEDGAMTDVPVRGRDRRIEKIPALWVSMMKDADKLPMSRRFVTPGALGFRFPTLADMMALDWCCEWDANTVLDMNGVREASGILGYWDHYDMHSCSDVRELAYIAGSARAMVHLFRWIRADAALATRRVIGSFDRDNAGMARLLERLGGVKTREVYEG